MTVPSLQTNRKHEFGCASVPESELLVVQLTGNLRSEESPQLISIDFMNYFPST